MPRPLVALIATLALLLVGAVFAPAQAKGLAKRPKEAAIVIDAQTGEVLFAQGADVSAYPASLTKIMTLYLAFEALEKGKLRAEQLLPVSRRAAGMAPSKLGLRAGQTIRVKDAVMGLVTKSANDAAVVVAEAIGGSEAEFAQMMTEKAQALGMGRTTFTNASGLPNARQVTTARDMAILALALQKRFPQYYPLFSARDFEFDGLTHRNHNNLLGLYDGTDGIKTGFINASGFNLVASVKRDGRRLIGVVFGGPTARARDIRMMRLLDAAFETPATGRGPDVRVAGLSVDEVAEVPPRRTARADSAKGKVKTASKSASAAESESADKTVWAIQVGAFSRKSAAQAAAEKALNKAKSILDSVTIAVVGPSSRKDKLYRARLVGLSEEEARKACRVLKKQRMHCMPLSTGLNSADLASLRG